tara:strand:- start:1810 stop:3003 length:1194 start_codon:yes stop_codon:yes gene_type:complete
MSSGGAQSWEGILIKDDYTGTITFPTAEITLTASGLEIKHKENITCASTAIISFTGTAPFKEVTSAGADGDIGYYIKYDNAGDATLDTSDVGMFTTSAKRAGFTFKIRPQASAKIGFMDGVYPKITLINPTSGTATFSPTFFYNTYTSSTKVRSNTMGNMGVNCLNLVVPSAITVTPNTKNFNDNKKSFVFDGQLTIQSTPFNWGYSSVEFVPWQANSPFPCTGSTSFGASNTFVAKYNKLVIGEPDTSTYLFTIADTQRITCGELIINGRLYSSATVGSDDTSEIHSLKRPKINGDWNFVQISDGVYRAKGTSEKLGVPYGGTGLDAVADNSLVYGNVQGALSTLAIGSAGQVLQVGSGGSPEWGSGGTGGSGTGLIDIGSITNDQDVKIEMGTLV